MSGITSSILLGSSEIIGWGSGRIEVVVFSSAEIKKYKDLRFFRKITMNYCDISSLLDNILPVAVAGRL